MSREASTSPESTKSFYLSRPDSSPSLTQRSLIAEVGYLDGMSSKVWPIGIGSVSYLDSHTVTGAVDRVASRHTSTIPSIAQTGPCT
jgi:hypothetical protein